MLAIRKCDGDYFIAPGGGQHERESLHDALVRECREELGTSVEIGERLFVRDYIARNHEFAAVDDAHALELMFACRVPDDYEPRNGDEIDTGQLGVAWIDPATARIYPAALRAAIATGSRGYLGDVNGPPPELQRVRFLQVGMRDGRYVPGMELLVTGATGKVGSRLAKRLAQRGDRVRALVRDRTRAAELSEHRIELVEGDLLDAKSLEAAVRGVDAVVHCAAFFRGATAEQAHAVNDVGTQYLARAARAATVKRFVFTSTGLVYGSQGGRVVDEDVDGAPTAAYPVSKLSAERFLLAVEGLDVRVLRLPFVYGDGDPHIAEAAPMMRGRSPTQRMSLGHHADIAQAVRLVLDASSPAHRIYNVVDDDAPDLATLMASVGAPPPDGSNAEAGRASDALLDGRRIRADLGFKPTYPRLADAIAAGVS
jgi:UDP-glucose 4-epimerase